MNKRIARDQIAFDDLAPFCGAMARKIAPSHDEEGPRWYQTFSSPAPVPPVCRFRQCCVLARPAIDRRLSDGNAAWFWIRAWHSRRVILKAAANPSFD
jgi:hypothetical protein